MKLFFKKSCIFLSKTAYAYLLKPLFFLIDPETVHNRMTKTGNFLGHFSPIRTVFAYAFQYKHKVLEQRIAGIEFENPIGLAAGFDYQAQLTNILPSVGFGFQTVGTITYLPYRGNKKPRLGRLPKSKSLMVNKGFKNDGATHVAKLLSHQYFQIPVGISVGRTNTVALDQEESIVDILRSFKTFESYPLHHSYYELNISCPNLYGDVTFYPPRKLEELLKEVDMLRLSRPVFIKMPIEKDNEEVLAMLKVIAKHSPAGIIFGNLQKNRKDPSLVTSEVAKFPRGNFSGKPTFDRSNELIALAYKNYKKRFVIIGCGGVFSAEDAYVKITLGASLVQLITGMVFQGPQLIADINLRLVELLKKDGFSHVAEAVGSKNIR